MIPHETTFSLGHMCWSKAGLVQHLLLGNNVCHLACRWRTQVRNGWYVLVWTTQNGGFCNAEQIPRVAQRGCSYHASSSKMKRITEASAGHLQVCKGRKIKFQKQWGGNDLPRRIAELIKGGKARRPWFHCDRVMNLTEMFLGEPCKC